ncbi:GntR family transcriptional regulator [Telmatospirillum sp. J64-1]|uniref:GntR family transcriptional regulator n=1 Tax=Telmatospirillum sp. J64-1 TaxID=2502183 RepID=UPI00163D6CBE|nr:GntR family transcriptional regulator [Telmatospirillum sp. J64-1]
MIEPAGLDRRGPMPLYHQIFSQLRADIYQGRYEATGLLESEQELENRFAVSRITIRRALDELERRGLIDRSRGRATRVLAGPSQRPAPVSLSGELNNALVIGLGTAVSLLDYATIPAPQDVAQTLGVPRATPLLWIERLRSRDGEPFCHVELHLPPWVAPHVSREAMERKPMLDILTEASFTLHHGTQSLSATAADARLAHLLRTTEGAPLLRLERVVREESGRALELVSIRFPADSFRYVMELTPAVSSAMPRVEA